MKMRNVLFYVLIYTLILAVSQILLKSGALEIGGLKIRGIKDIFFLAPQVLKNKAIMAGMILMISSFFLWLFILSWSKLGLVFPLTALVYVFVAFMSYFILGEKLATYNYLGIFLIITGVFFLLHR